MREDVFDVQDLSAKAETTRSESWNCVFTSAWVRHATARTARIQFASANAASEYFSLNSRIRRSLILTINVPRKGAENQASQTGGFACSRKRVFRWLAGSRRGRASRMSRNSVQPWGLGRLPGADSIKERVAPGAHALSPTPYGSRSNVVGLFSVHIY